MKSGAQRRAGPLTVPVTAPATVRPAVRLALHFLIPFALLWVSGGAVASTGTVTTPPRDSALQRAAELEAEGCYRCLVEARDLYAPLVDPPALAAATSGLFRTTLLIGMREREMGLPQRDTFDRAAELANAPLAPPTWRTFVEIAETTPWQPDGVPKSLSDLNIALGIHASQAREAWNAVILPLTSAPPASYLHLRLSCRNLRGAEPPQTLRDVAAGHPEALFVRYAFARCTDDLVEQSAIQTLSPAFTEI